MGFFDLFRNRSNIIILAGALTASALLYRDYLDDQNQYLSEQKQERKDQELRLVTQKMGELQADLDKKLILIEDVQENISKAGSYKRHGDLKKSKFLLKLQLPKLTNLSFENHFKNLEALKVESHNNQNISRILRENNQENHFDDMINSVQLLERRRLSLIAEINSELKH